jgi:hypothetical protein
MIYASQAESQIIICILSLNECIKMQNTIDQYLFSRYSDKAGVYQGEIS